MTDPAHCRTLFIHAAALGDFVLSLPILAGLHRGGAASLSILGRPAIAGLARNAMPVRDILDLAADGFHTLFAPHADPPPRVRDAIARHDLILSTLGDPGGPFAQNLAAICPGRVITIDPRLRADWPGHVTDQWLADFRAAGLDLGAAPPRLVISASAREAARHTLAPPGDAPIALIHPGSGGASKCWPLDRFLAVAQTLVGRAVHVAFILGPAELERFSAAERRAIDAVGATIMDPPLGELAALVAEARLYLGNDAGPTHLAAAVGTRVVAVFGPTDPAHWRPPGDNVAVVRGSPWPDVGTVIRAASRALDGD